MSLKALAERVLSRDKRGTKSETNIHIMSHSSFLHVWDDGTVLTAEEKSDFEERAGIMEYDGGLTRTDAEARAMKDILSKREIN